jgi:hypothetical protein
MASTSGSEYAGRTSWHEQGAVTERAGDVGFVLLLAVCAGVVLTVCGLLWLMLGGEYDEDPEDELP